jgi:hypothetical protein
MLHTHQNSRVWDQGPVTIRPLTGLTQHACDAVNEAIRQVPGSWTVEQHDDYDGYLSLLISHESDPNPVTYLISGKIGQIELAQFQHDQLQTVGQFKDIEATVSELVTRLNRCTEGK